MDLRRFLNRCFNRFPKKTAFVDKNGEKHNFQELEKKVESASAGLKEKGMEKGDTLALMTENNLQGFIIMLAAWKSGITVAEVKPKTSAENIKYYIDDSKAEILFYNANQQGKIDKIRDRLEVEAVKIEEFEKGEPSNSIEIEEDLDEEFARLSYTSGTTGLPKGVPVSHDRLLSSVYVILMRDEVVEGDNVCLIYPYYGVGVLEILASLSSGATVYLPPNRSSESTLETIEKHEITSIGGVPTQLKSLAEKADPYDTSSLRYVHTGSGVLTREVHRMIKEELCQTVCTSYGSSEAGETLYSLNDSISIGRPTRFQEVRLVEEDEKDPSKVIEGEGSGELIVKADGPQVFDSYWDRPDKTDEVMIDGWYFTGDIVYRDTEGMFWFRGRDDDMIISGGENISPADVENTLLKHPGVQNAGAVGIEDEKWGEKVVGFIATGQEISKEELDKHCKESDLENFKRPKEYVIMEKLPLNETGGVERQKLKEKY